MTTQTFKVVGITVHGESTKIRFTDDMVRRIKQFNKGGATRCDFIELPNEMSKLEALKYMAAHPDFQSVNDQATIADAIEDRQKDTKQATVKVKVTKSKDKPSIESIKSRMKDVKKTSSESVEVVTTVEVNEVIS